MYPSPDNKSGFDLQVPLSLDNITQHLTIELSMQARKTQSEIAATHPFPNSFYYLIDDQTRFSLQSLGPRIRKDVSNGHLTPSKLPSFKAVPLAPLDVDIKKHQYQAEMANRAKSMNAAEFNVQQIRSELNDDEYGDTDDDEDESTRPVLDKDNKLYFRPLSHRSHSSQVEDLPEADFLRKH